MQYNPITVTDLNKYIKGRIDNDEMLNNVLVKGEISNFKNHYTGHMYFTLKDENSLIKCVMFKTYTTHLSFMPKRRNEGNNSRRRFGIRKRWSISDICKSYEGRWPRRLICCI